MNICSLNARGLNDRRKRKAVFQHLRNMKDTDLFLIQEAHVKDLEQSKLWKSEWGGQMYSSYGESNSKGVMTMVHPNSDIKLRKLDCDTEGRILCCEVKIADKLLVLCNIYAPNDDNPGYFRNVIRMVDRCQQSTPAVDGVIIGGDFNLVLEPELDRLNSLRNHEKARLVVTEMIEQLSLCDVWRVRNADTRRYTWHRWTQHRPQASRIDMVLVPQWMLDQVTDCDINPGFMTDHSFVQLTVGIESFHRGKGVWKFNNKLLSDEKFCLQCENVINESIQCSSHIDPNNRWEFIKMETGRFCKRFAKKKARKTRERIQLLLKRKKKLEIKVVHNLLNQNVSNQVKNINVELETHAIEEASKAIFRSQCNYARDGEKCTAYFLTLEKTRYLEKNMKCVITDDGCISTNQDRILEEQTNFYKKLYSSDPNVHFTMLREESEPCINDEFKEKCDMPITLDELYDAMMTLRPNKVPGLDGFTIEFYRKFWKILSPMLMEMYLYSWNNGLLPESVRQGLISLLPKKIQRY